MYRNSRVTDPSSFDPVMLGTPVGLSDIQDKGFLCGIALPSKQRSLPELHQRRLSVKLNKTSLRSAVSTYYATSKL